MGRKVKAPRVTDVAEMGREGGRATAASGRKAASPKAVKARWDKYSRHHPGKLKAKLAKGKKAIR
jgi:hypothetical protein